MAALCLFKETRVSYEPTPAAPIAQLELPSTSAFSRASRVTSKIQISSSLAKDEQEYRRKNVATSGSIFFRSNLHNEAKYPRAIAWRCLEGNTVLELRSVDISKSASTPKDACYAIQVVFPYAIQGSGVALADSAEDNVLSVFVALKSNDLYTLSVKPTFFWSPTIATEEGDRWFKVSRPSALANSTFHRLFALSSLTLLVASTDGRLTRLSRKQGEDGSAWGESSYEDGEHSSFRSLLPWQNKDTVRFEGINLSQRTVHAAAISPDHQHILTVGLDHYLRAWSVSGKQPTCSRDILNLPRAEEQAGRYTIDPRTPNNLRIFESRPGRGTRYYAMTFSPYQSGLFKIWTVHDADSDEGITDAFEEASLKLPDPGDGALWTLSDYAIQSSADTPEMTVWVLLRLNRRYKLYSQRFDDLASIGSDWGRGWTVTKVDASKHEPDAQPPSVGFDHQDLTSEWIDYVFRPDQPPQEILETALAIYAQGRDIKLPKQSKASLAGRIASLIGSQAELQTGELNMSDFEKVEQKLSLEWCHFWNVVKDLDNTRWEPLSLSLDKAHIMPWISFANGCAPIRQCSSIEILAHNIPATLKHGIPTGLRQSIENDDRSTSPHVLEQQALIIELGALLRSSFSEEAKHQCEALLTEELWLDPRDTPSARMRDFARACNFAEEISERQQNELVQAFDQKKGPNILTTRLFLSMIEHLSMAMARNSSHVSTEFGVRAIVFGAQDMIALHLRVLQDLLYLVIYLEVQIDRHAFPMKNLESELVFAALLEQLRVAHVARWLAVNTRPVSKARSNDQLDPSHPTVLEDLFARDIKPQDDGIQSQCSTLTTSIRDLLTWCAGGHVISLDKALVTIQCDLIKNGNLDLAESFQQFQPSTPWSIYIQGRLALACRNPSEAAGHFSQAAFGLSRPAPPSSEYQISSSSLLDPMTASFLASGIPNYYAHIVSLFGSASAICHAEVLHFSQLALLHSPAAEQRADLLSRLFNSSLALNLFETAYGAIVRFEDKALQRSTIREMVGTMVSKGAIEELLGFAFPPVLSKEVDGLLTEKARAEKVAPTTSGACDVPWFKVLYAWRIRQGDLRGAAAVLVERLEGAGKGRGSSRGLLNTSSKAFAARLDEYLVGINALALVGEDEGDEGWVFVEKEGGKRRVVRLKDLRDAYGEEMDRVGALEMGRYGIVGGDEEDEDEGEDVEMGGS